MHTWDETDGPLAFAQGCKMGIEGIVSSRGIRATVLGARRIPNAWAVKLEAEEDWGRPWRA